MSCGCKGGKHFDGVPHDARPYDTQAQQLVASPKVDVEVARPERVDRSRFLVEYTPQPPVTPSTPGLPAVFQLETPLSSLALTGYIPYNCVAFIVPVESAAALKDPATLMRLSQAVCLNAPLAGFLTIPGLEQYWIMRPGEILNFKRRMSGFAGFFAAPWSGLFPLVPYPWVTLGSGGSQASADPAKSANAVLNSIRQQQLQGGVAAALLNGGVNGTGLHIGGGFTSSWDPVLPTSGAIFAPVFRAMYGQSEGVTIPVNRTPWVFPNVCTVHGSNSAVCVPPGSRYVTLNFGGLPGGSFGNTTSGAGLPCYDNPATPYGYDNSLRVGLSKKVVTAQGPHSMRVRWWGYDGLFHEHPADQLDVNGRGPVTQPHDIETYEIPNNVIAMSVHYINPAPDANYNDWVDRCTYTFSGGH